MVHESKHQQAVIKWSQQSSIRSKWPELALLHHIKNETREGAKQIAIDKAIGSRRACRICPCQYRAADIMDYTLR